MGWDGLEESKTLRDTRELRKALTVRMEHRGQDGPHQMSFTKAMKNSSKFVAYFMSFHLGIFYVFVFS